MSPKPVSYTHLDVYKRQPSHTLKVFFSYQQKTLHLKKASETEWTHVSNLKTEQLIICSAMFLFTQVNFLNSSFYVYCNSTLKIYISDTGKLWNYKT